MNFSELRTIANAFGLFKDLFKLFLILWALRHAVVFIAVVIFVWYGLTHEGNPDYHYNDGSGRTYIDRRQIVPIFTPTHH